MVALCGWGARAVWSLRTGARKRPPAALLPTHNLVSNKYKYLGGRRSVVILHFIFQYCTSYFEFTAAILVAGAGAKANASISVPANVPLASSNNRVHHKGQSLRPFI